MVEERTVEQLLEQVWAVAQLARKISDESQPDLYYKGGADALEQLYRVLTED